MKRSVVQYAAGSLGMILVVVGVVWTCQKLSSPPQLNAASGSGTNGDFVAPSSTRPETTGNEKTSLSLNESADDSASVLNRPVANDSVSFPSIDSPTVSFSPLDDDSLADDGFASEKPIDAPNASNDVAPNLSEFNESPSFNQSRPVAEINRSETLRSDSAVPFESEIYSESPGSSTLQTPNENNDGRYSYPTSDPYASPTTLQNAPKVSNVDSSSNAGRFSDGIGSTESNVLNYNSSNNQNNAAYSNDQVAVQKTGNFDEMNRSSYPPSVPSVAMNSNADEIVATDSIDGGTQAQNQGVGRPGTDEISGPQQAQLTIEKVVSEEIQINQESIFKIILNNVGNATAKSVELKELVPAGTSLVSTSPQTTSAVRGELVWNGFDLKAGESREFSYSILPLEEGEIGSVATVEFQTEVSGKTLCTRPALALKVDAPKNVLIGENVTLDVVVSNPGTGTATGVVLLENVPNGLRHPSGNVLENRIETLKPNESKTISLTLQSVSPGLIENRLKISADNGLEEEAISQIQVDAPELSLAIDGTKNRYLERNAVYRLTVENPGTAVARDVKLIAELPREAEFVSANNLGEYDAEKHSVHWELAELPNKVAPGEIELVLLPKTIGTGSLVFKATGLHNLSAEVSQEIVVDGLAAVSYEVKALTDPVEVGRDAVYEIRIANRGTKESSNVALQIFLPDEMKVLASDGPTRCNEKPGGVSFDPLAKLDAKSEIVYKIKAVGSVPGDLRIKVQVSSDDLEPLIKEESIRIYN